MLRFLLLLFLSMALSSQADAQYYIRGQEPPSVRWKEKQVDNGSIIYPKGLDSIANSYAHYLNHALQVVPHTLNHYPKKTPTVIHGNSILSNGFVSWAPKRIEIVSTPSLSPSPEPWLLMLALHEYRHVVQVDKLNQGFFRPAYYLFGQQAVGAAVGLVPLWFLEGDAVFTETSYSLGGRGRQASFYQHYRTHLISNNGLKYNYDKWLMGSYKDFIPNHYHFGYQMVGYGNFKYGFNIWSNALDYTARKPYSLFPFYFSLKKDTGLSRKGLFKESFHYLDSLWSSSDITDEYDYLIENKNAKTYTDYRYPFMANDSTLIALKTNLTQGTFIVAVDLTTGSEKIIHRPGYITQRVSYTENFIYWSQYRAHPRWEYQNFSEVWRYDISLGEAQKITNGTRYFNPIHYSWGKIALIEMTPQGKNFLKVIRTNGEEVQSLSIPESLEPKEICLGKESELVVRCSSPNGTVLLSYKNLNAQPDTVFGPVFLDISNISYKSNMLFFTASKNYKEDAFFVNILTQKVYQVTNSTYGLTNISLQDDYVMVATVFNDNGSLPASIPIKPYEKESIDIIQMHVPLYNFSNKNIHNDLSSIPNKNIINDQESTSFSKTKNILNFHSWAPVYFNPFDAVNGYFEMHPGATVISQNLTSTMALSLGYSYFQTHGFHAHGEWMGWYPKISFGVDIGNEHAVRVSGPEPGRRSEPRVLSTLRVRIPVNISSSYVVSLLNVGLRGSYSNRQLWDRNINAYNEGETIIEPYLSFYALTRMAHRDIRPRFGAHFYTGIVTSPLNVGMFGNSSVFRGGLYLPGLGQNNSIYLTAQWETQETVQYLRSSRIFYPRGFQSLIVKQIATFSADYASPLLYPDLPLGPIVYIKRLFANAFFDYGQAQQFKRTDTDAFFQNKKLCSTGLEFHSDLHFFRTPYQLRVGYRAGVRLDTNSLFHELVFNINLANLFGHLPNNNFYKLNL